jgi:hypothetical protein
MSNIQNDAAKGFVAIAYASLAGQVVAQRYTYTVPTTIAEGDIIEMAPIPAGHRVVGMVLDSDDLDSGTPAIVWDVGIMSGNWGDTGVRTCGAEFFASSTVSQGGTTAQPTLKTAYRTAKADNHRSIGLKLVTDAATAVEGVIGLTVFCVAE